MNIAIVGYGKMGKEIEKVLIEKKIPPKTTIDNYLTDANFQKLDDESLKNIDVAIDFSNSQTLEENLNAYLKYKVAVVLGTTGWYDKMEYVKKTVGNQIGLIWSGNFSIGMNIYFRIIREAARIINKFEEYDPLLYELHHNKKKDSPSGTAKMIAKILQDEIKRKTNIIEEKLDRQIAQEEIHLASIRGGYIPGIHTVLFDSEVDTIEITHSARNREGLARGAVMAAQWIINKKGFFSIDDMMNSIII